MNFKFNAEPNITESRPFSSKAEMIADKFKQWVVRKNIDLETLTSEEQIKGEVLRSHLLMPGMTAEEVIVELKKLGIVSIAPAQKQVKVPVKEEVQKIETEYVQLKGITEVKDENVIKQLEENKFFEELEKNVFKNDKDLESVYHQSLSLGKENSVEVIETIEYYNEFADKGLIKGGREEVKKDFQNKEDRKELFKKKTELLSAEEINKLEKNKKIATILERGVAYGVSNLAWYGNNVSVEPTCEFDDIKRRTDGILEVRKGDDESSFMGLGIDVTYRGLYSEKYKEKLHVLLQSIKDGHKTKIKYFKNHKGEMVKEFAVPKTILYFNIEDVKDMVYMIKNINDPKVKEDFRNSPQKFTVMNQMIIQCEMLSIFAEKYHNNIFRKYTDIVSSIKELAWTNPEIKKILDARHEDEASIHMKFLIKEFEDSHQ